MCVLITFVAVAKIIRKNNLMYHFYADNIQLYVLVKPRYDAAVVHIQKCAVGQDSKTSSCLLIIPNSFNKLATLKLTTHNVHWQLFGHCNS